MTYEVWDTETNNLVGAFDTKREALALIRAVVHNHGREYVATFALGNHAPRGRMRAIAEGSQLAELAILPETTAVVYCPPQPSSVHAVALHRGDSSPKGKRSPATRAPEPKSATSQVPADRADAAVVTQKSSKKGRTTISLSPSPR